MAATAVGEVVGSHWSAGVVGGAPLWLSAVVAAGVGGVRRPWHVQRQCLHAWVGGSAVGGVGGDECDGEGVGVTMPVHYRGVLWRGGEIYAGPHGDGDGGISAGRVDWNVYELGRGGRGGVGIARW